MLRFGLRPTLRMTAKPTRNTNKSSHNNWIKFRGYSIFTHRSSLIFAPSFGAKSLILALCVSAWHRPETEGVLRRLWVLFTAQEDGQPSRISEWGDSHAQKFEEPPSENDEEPEFLNTFLNSIYLSSVFIDKTLKISLFLLIIFIYSSFSFFCIKLILFFS